ncbi:MAG: hypothetical protein GX205_00230 [Firmicutes bacterium]|nr:hypothetical protein [Bacillota bacterium]
MEWWQMWLLMSIALCIGAWLQVGYRLGAFACGALVCLGAALIGTAPITQVQLFLAASYVALVVSTRVQELLDRF